MIYVSLQDDISLLHLSARLANCLRRVGIHTIGAMLDYPINKFAGIHNMGIKSTEEITLVTRNLINGIGEYVLVEAKEMDNKVIVTDIPISELPLSPRTKNVLTQNGYIVTSQLNGITYEQLIKMQKMGRKSSEEVLEYLRKNSESHMLPQNTSKTYFFERELADELFATYGKTTNVWLREVLFIRSQFPEAIGETFVYRLYERVIVRDSAKAMLLRIVEKNGGEISKAALEHALPRHLKNTTILEEILLELETISAIQLGEIKIYRLYPTIIDYIAHIEDERIREVIQGRIEGKTLQEIGEKYGITRERVRQLMQKGLQKKPYLREDKYIYIYDHYDFSLEDFTLAYDEASETYYYLEMISQINRVKKKPLEDILSDTSVFPEFRKKAEIAIYKSYISSDGMRVKMTRPNLVRHFIRINCKSITKYDDFVCEYHSWLDSMGLRSNPTLLLEARTYENTLNQSDYVLWNQGRSFRYYNIQEHEFEELFLTLDLEQFDGVELSTLKLFRDYPDLMQQYDIQDEYELHNLLKKVWPKERKGITFKKMPTIEIGKADRKNQLLTLLLQYAPISAEDLTKHYEEEYGVKAATVRGSYLRDIDVYFYNGVYSVDYPGMLSNQFDRMKMILNRDFYTIQEVKRLFKREFSTSDASVINPNTLKKLGFHIYPGYSGYIVKNSFSSATDYFRRILTQNDIVDIREHGSVIRSIATYGSEYHKLRNNYEIIEFLPFQYINIRRLNEVGITKEHLKSFCRSVANQYDKGEYFTVTSLWKNGFKHEMDELGFDEWFYASILVEDRENFSFQRIGGTRIFICGKPCANMGDMLIWLLERYEKIDLYELLDLLGNYYGIKLPREKLLAIISDTELYYDLIMDAVYINYDTYFEEI